MPLLHQDEESNVMPTSLSEKFIRDVPPPEKGKQIFWDDHRDAPRGFGLRVMAAGTKSFVLRYRAASGAARIQTIGEWPKPWSLAAARIEAGNIRRKVDQGADPLAERRQERAEPSVAELVEEFAEARLGELDSGEEIRRYFDRDLLPVLGKRKVRSIKRRDIIAVVETKAKTAPRAAALLLTYTKLLLSFAEDREIIEISPATGIKAARISKSMMTVKRGRVLEDEEIRSLWLSAESCGIHRLTAIALKLILVTGQRPGEVCGLTWDEIDTRTWTIPAARRKTETGHSIYLTDSALELLEHARKEKARLIERRGWTESPILFEHRQGQAATTRGLSRALVRFHPELGNKNHPDWGHWTPHDLRRTCRSRLSEIGIPQEIAERVIGHTAKGVVAVYDHHRYQHEIRAALEAWDGRLNGIIEPRADNVVILAGKEALRDLNTKILGG
jgi:integrase